MKEQVVSDRTVTVNAARLEVTLKTMQQSLGGCLTCGGLTNGLGVFFPNHPRKFGAAKGKDRAIVYRICEVCHGCHGCHGWMERVETMLLVRIESEEKIQ